MGEPGDASFKLVQGVDNPDIGPLVVVFENLDVINAQGADTRYSTGGLMLGNRLRQDHHSRDVIEDIYTARRNRGANLYAPYMGELILRVCAMAAEETKEELAFKWPEEYVQEAAWQELLDRIFDPVDQYGQLGNFIVRASVGEVQSNIAERAIFTQLGMKTFSNRLGEAPAGWDGGCANNLHGKAILAPINIFTGIAVTPNGSPETDEKLRLYLAEIAQQKRLVSQWTGIERLDDLSALNTDGRVWNTTDMELWSFVHSVRPDERVNNPERSRIHQQIAAVESDRIRLVHADLARPLSLKSTGLGAHEYDFGIYSVAMSQNESADRVTMQQNGDLLTRKDGIELVLDYMKPSEDDPNVLVHVEQRDEFSLHGLVRDLSRPELGYRILALFKTGRCRDVMAGKDFEAIVADAA